MQRKRHFKRKFRDCFKLRWSNILSHSNAGIHLFIYLFFFFLELILRGGGRGDIGICGVAVSLIISGGDLKPYGVWCF